MRKHIQIMGCDCTFEISPDNPDSDGPMMRNAIKACMERMVDAICPVPLPSFEEAMRSRGREERESVLWAAMRETQDGIQSIQFFEYKNDADVWVSGRNKETSEELWYVTQVFAGVAL